MDALRKLYPQIVTTLDDKAFDANGNEVAYDLQAVITQAEEDAQAQINVKQTAQAKLAKLGLTPEDLKALLG